MNLIALILLLQLGQGNASVPADGIFGTWEAHNRTIFNIYPCGVTNGQGGDPKEACVRLLQSAPSDGRDPIDRENPDPQKRDRPLRLDVIGTKYKVIDPEHAEGGKLYDPDNGRTYPSTATIKNGELKLHGTRFLFFGHTITCRRVQLAKPSPYTPYPSRASRPTRKPR